MIRYRQIKNPLTKGVENMITKIYKIYGAEGHRQRESFFESYSYDWSEGNNIRIIKVLNSDLTGTHKYSMIAITRNSAEECDEELRAQLSDGFFENSRVGMIEELDGEELVRLYHGQDKEFTFAGSVCDICEYMNIDKSEVKDFYDLDEMIERENDGMNFYHVEKIDEIGGIR